MSKEQISEAARTLSERGASKGGIARAAKLSAQERIASAKKAAEARWAGDIPRATHGDPDHPLKIGGIEIPCYVLENGKRVLYQRAMVDALDMSRGSSSTSGGDRLAKFCTGKAIKPFMEAKLGAVTEPIRFRTPTGAVAYGYDATILADICEAVLKAREQGLLQQQQEHIAARCEILVRGFARVGIIALVDEATGYQEDRARDALTEILRAFISDELRKWAKTFPDEYFRQLCRLRGIPVGRIDSHRPQYIGHLTNDIVYRRLAPGVLKRLRQVTPKTSRGNRRHKFFQRLTEDIGDPALREHLASAITLMRVCGDGEWRKFMGLLDMALPRQKELPLFDNLPDENKTRIPEKAEGVPRLGGVADL